VFTKQFGNVAKSLLKLHRSTFPIQLYSNHDPQFLGFLPSRMWFERRVYAVFTVWKKLGIIFWN